MVALETTAPDSAEGEPRELLAQRCRVEAERLILRAGDESARVELERETGGDLPGTKHPVEFVYRLRVAPPGVGCRHGRPIAPGAALA